MPDAKEFNNLRELRKNKRTESFSHHNDRDINPLDSIRQAQRRAVPVPGSQMISRRDNEYGGLEVKQKKGFLER